MDAAVKTAAAATRPSASTSPATHADEKGKEGYEFDRTHGGSRWRGWRDLVGGVRVGFAVRISRAEMDHCVWRAGGERDRPIAREPERERERTREARTEGADERTSGRPGQDGRQT